MINRSSKNFWLPVPILELQADTCPFSCLWDCDESRVRDQIQGCFTVKKEKKKCFCGIVCQKFVKGMALSKGPSSTEKPDGGHGAL